MANNNFYQYPMLGQNFNQGYQQGYNGYNPNTNNQQQYQPQQFQSQYQAQQFQPQYNQYQPPLSQQGLNGKIVESCDIVKATEIPMNSYGIFPQADMTHIYIKTWNTDGTTKITDYIPVIGDEKVKEQKAEKYTDMLNEVYNALNDSIVNLEKKIDAINVKQDDVKKTPTSIRKKVVDDGK